MRIFGGHDYYDIGLSMGIDPLIVLQRFKDNTVPSKEVPVDLKTLSLQTICNDRWNDDNHLFHVEAIVVVFAGKVYRGLHVYTSPGRMIRQEDKVDEFFWSYDRLQAWVDSQKIYIRFRGNWRDRDKKDSDKDVIDYFNISEAPNQLREWLIGEKLSIVVISEKPYRSAWRPYWQDNALVNHDGLGKIGFAKALDPFMAFQELSMWIGGILGGTSPEMVRITDDKVLIENHGYDKHSFRSSSRVA